MMQYVFTPRDLQYLFDRANLRSSIAEFEGNKDETFLATAESLLVAQYAGFMGWRFEEGILKT